MLIVLNISYSLVQIAIWTDATGSEAVLDLAKELFDNWHPVFSDHDALHFQWLHL